MTYTFYTLHGRVLNLLASIHHRLGEVQARHLQQPPADLTKAYHVSAVHATLAIEGGQLAPLPVAELVSRPSSGGDPVALEAVNTHRAHDLLPGLDPFLALDFRHAHGVMMHGLALDAGQYRTGPMDVLYGDPSPLRTAPADNIPIQVEELLHFVETDENPAIITSCVLHFGLVYLRPFTAGNGRMARLWQRRVLMQQWPVFAFLPVEAFIHRTQAAYHAALEYADRREDCGNFIIYMMERIDEALAEVLTARDPVLQGSGRMALFIRQGPQRAFSRKDYLRFFPELSTASASRDLREAVDDRRLLREGTGRTAIYRKVE